MNTAHPTLNAMRATLDACQQGQCPAHQLAAQWRSQASTLPLPARFGEVLHDALDRLEAGALFNEESCSFSQKDLLAGLQLWLDKAGQRLG